MSFAIFIGFRNILDTVCATCIGVSNVLSSLCIGFRHFRIVPESTIEDLPKARLSGDCVESTMTCR